MHVQPVYSVGIDASATGTGVVVLRADGSFVSTWDSTTIKTPLKGLARLHYIQKTLIGVMEGAGGPVDRVVIEGYAYGNPYSIVTLVEVGTSIRLALKAHGFPAPVEVAPLSLKKFATGSGNAKKEQIMKEVLKNWQFDAPTSDEADAYVLARIGLCLDGVVPTLTKQQEEVVKNLKKKVTKG